MCTKFHGHSVTLAKVRVGVNITPPPGETSPPPDPGGNRVKEVCHDVKKEPLFTQLNNENLQEPSAVGGNEARLDVSASGFWVKGQRVFCKGL